MTKKKSKLFTIGITTMILIAATTFTAYAGGGDQPPSGLDCTVGDGSVECKTDCTGCGEEVIIIIESEKGDFQGGMGQSWCYPSGTGPSADDLANQGGWTDLGGGFFECEWKCGDETVAFSTNGNDENWGIDYDPGNNGQGDFDFSGDFSGGSMDGSIFGDTDTAGIPSCGEWGTTRAQEICWRNLTIKEGIIICAGDYELSASASVPCPKVERQPYPRAIVNAPVVFQVSASGSSSQDSSRYWCEVNIRNYTIEVGWDLIQITPTWYFDERPWSTEPNAAQGFSVYHTYNTSSEGLTPLGPSLQGNLELPAYQVSVTSYWQPYVIAKWEQWKNFKFDCGENDPACKQDKEYCSGLSRLAKIDNPVCGYWRARSTGKLALNLMDFGYSEPYHIKTGAVDITKPPAGIPEIGPDERICKVFVPVIESQGLISSP